MELRKQQSLFAQQIGMLIKYVFDSGYSCTLGEVFRTQEQAEIFAKENKGVADSLHCKRLALDLNLISPDGKYLTDSKDYQKFGVFWESLDTVNRWGGKFKRVDGNHFERNA